MRMVTDQDRDLIPDTHDALPTIGNQWEDSDSDGYGDNPNGPLADACPSDDGSRCMIDSDVKTMTTMAGLMLLTIALATVEHGGPNRL